MYHKFVCTLIAAYYVNGVQGRPQALAKLTWSEFELAKNAGEDPASRHLKTAINYGFQVSFNA